jgi:tetratricopeptide (TPR) repeat protein
MQNSYAQNKTFIDSLQKVYNNATSHDTAKIWSLVGIANEYRRIKPDTCITIAQKALINSQNSNFKKGIIRSFRLLGLAHHYQGKYETALSHYQNALKISEEIDYEPSLLYSNIGNTYSSLGKYPTALEYFQKSLAIDEKKKDKRGISSALNNIGNVYVNISNYPPALDNYLKSVKIDEELGDKEGVAIGLNNIGNIYANMNNFNTALEYYDKSLAIKEKLGNKRSLAITLTGIGNMHLKKENYPVALEYYQKSLKLQEETKDKRYMAISLNNIGFVYASQGKDSLALEYYQKSLAMREEMKEKLGIAESYKNLALLAYKQQDYDRSIEYAQKGVVVTQEIKNLVTLVSLDEILYKNYKQKKDWEKSIYHLEHFKLLHDSIFDLEKEKSVANLESRFLVEKQGKELELLAKTNEMNKLSAEKGAKELEIAKKEAEANRLIALAQKEKDQRKQDSLRSLAQKNQLEADKLKIENEKKTLEALKVQEEKELQQTINYLIVVLLFVALLAIGSIWRNRRKIQRANKQLANANEDILQKNEEINQQKEELLQTLEVVEAQRNAINRQNENTIASIHYASRIQSAIMPKETELQKYLNCFVFFRPRDIVSGDFYWFSEKGNKKILAVADCTGHGVSGAFMTMIGNDLLNQIIHNLEIHEPNKILAMMSSLLAKTLTHAEGKIKDGMDMSIIAIHTVDKIHDKQVITYAGAMNPLYYVENGNFKEIKADKKPIGGEGEVDFLYTQHHVELAINAKNDNSQTMLYLCSDGYQDQFGGEHDRKFMVINFKKLLQNIALQPLTTQKEIVAQTFDTWRRGQRQTDDVLVIGVQI